MDAEEEREKKRVKLADDPSNRAMVQRDLHLLPREILLEILSRLPVKSLIHFKSTSRAGSNLVADPRLRQMFHNRVSDSNPCLILFPLDQSSVFCRTRQRYFVDRVDCSGRVRNFDPPQHSEDSTQLVGYCNGLLCFSCTIIGDSSRSRSLLIYNPLVGDAVTVPLANEVFLQYEVFGFGFHPRTGKFKVVRIVTVIDPAVQVFTVGTTEWRNKGAPPQQFGLGIGLPEALVEGSLHWVTLDRMGGIGRIWGIISFDFADEVFEEVPHPPCQRLVSHRYSVSVLNGCLSAVGLVDAVHFDIWVMKKYHVKESWVKRFSFDPNLPPWPRNISSSVRFICALKNGEILLQYNNSALVSYDPVENRFKTLQISGLPSKFGVFPFLPSPFSAKATMNL